MEFTAFGITISLLATEPVTRSDSVRFLVIAVMALGYAEAGARIARLKRYLCPGGDKPLSNELSVWAFAAVLTLPAGLTSLLMAALYAHSLFRRTRDRTGVPYRVVFSGSTMMLAAQAASAVLAAGKTRDVLGGGWLAPLAVVAALLVFGTVNFGLLVTGMWLARRPRAFRTMLPDPDAFGYEIATLVLGIVTAEFLVHTAALTPVALILAAYLHRSSLVNALHRNSRLDSKTGLLNLTAWTLHAQGVLSHSYRNRLAATVLFCDLDHFKDVNDVHGHVRGDDVIAEVADCLRRELRGSDGIGRFGGEEFVVVLDSLEEYDAEAVAGRLRTAVSALRFDNGLRITMSVGLAQHRPNSGPPQLQDLVGRADAALRTAKADGRNCVRAG